MKTIELKNALQLSVFSHEMLYSLLEKSISNVNEITCRINSIYSRINKPYSSIKKTFSTIN